MYIGINVYKLPVPHGPVQGSAASFQMPETKTYNTQHSRCLRVQSRIVFSLPPPGFSESGIPLASATGKPLGFL